MMKLALFGLATAVLLGCTVGSGAGEASGPLYIANCGDYSGPQKLSDPMVFNLDPEFFAAEAVEDIRPGKKLNRIQIRMQRYGGSVENSDVLSFNVVNSYEVARCLRGRKELTTDGMLVPDYEESVCFWPESGGPPRMRVGPTEFIRASLTPFGSCRADNRPLNVVGTAVACAGQTIDLGCPDSAGPADWASYIVFEYFGSIDAPDKDSTRYKSPTERAAVGQNFKVEFDQRLRATSFVLTIQDDLLLSEEISPAPMAPRIKGTLMGHFDFDFERGRAVQTFP